MKWIKRGKIFDPSEHNVLGGGCTFAQSPQTLIFEGRVRIYYSTRKVDPHNGKFISHIGFVDFDKSFREVLRVSESPVIRMGELGSFDEHGIFPINPVRVGEKIFAYTCGWSRRVSVSVETSIGLAFSRDGGDTFERSGSGPVLSSSLYEPMLVGDAFVQVYDDTFHMWYIYGKGWKDATETEPPARVYKIAHATSVDGIEWTKEGKQIVTDRLNADECQALPTVIKLGSRWHMVFCYREATDFRTNPERGYRIGYCYSDDAWTWTRDDDNVGIAFSKDGWDSEMMCYPHLFECDGKTYMLYNGNEFGRYGFGLAELEGF